MNNTVAATLTVIMPLVGTTIGAALVYVIADGFKVLLEKFLVGFAVGVMFAASVWSLLIPAMSMTESYGEFRWIPAALGFFLGVIILMLIDYIVPVPNSESITSRENRTKRRSIMLFASITMHNLPEGMAVGVIIAGMLDQYSGITAVNAMALSIGISIQNIPEGAIISAPLRESGLSKNKCFLAGVTSGIVEPIGAIITVILLSGVSVLLPYILSFAAGAMFYVVIKELIPDIFANGFSALGAIGSSIGFCVMMILDVMLS